MPLGDYIFKFFLLICFSKGSIVANMTILVPAIEEATITWKLNAAFDSIGLRTRGLCEFYSIHYSDMMFDSRGLHITTYSIANLQV